MTYIPPLLDVVITGQGSQLALNQNIILATAGAGAYDTVLTSANQMYRSWSIQITPAAGTVTAGAITFEGSNDNTNFTPIFLIDEANITANPITNYTLVASTTRYFKGPIAWRYVRARISTAVTGTTTGVQAFTRFTTEPFTDQRLTVSQATAANLQATVTATNLSTNVAQINGVAPLMGNGVTGTGSPRVTLATDSTGVVGVFIPTPVADVASAAITTTTTTSAFTPTAGNGYQVVIPVTAVSGTTPTMAVAIEESDDSGTNWFRRYLFPTITATGIYRSPILKLRGNRVRYVQTITGTTPSFTRAINRNQRQDTMFGGASGKVTSAASTNATSVFAFPCEVMELTAGNNSTVARYLKVYDLAVAPTVGTSVPIATYIIPPTGGSNIPLTYTKQFMTGFALAITVNMADSDATAVGANEVTINYQIG